MKSIFLNKLGARFLRSIYQFLVILITSKPKRKAYYAAYRFICRILAIIQRIMVVMLMSIGRNIAGILLQSLGFVPAVAYRYVTEDTMLIMLRDYYLGCGN